MTNRNSVLLRAVATLMGTIVGAGFLGIPKALTLSGFLPGVLIMMAVAIVMIIMSMFATELSLNTKKVCQMPGMVSKYLGKKAGAFASVIFALISLGAMVAYLIGCSTILAKYTGISQYACMVIYFFIIFLIVHKGLRLIEKVEVYIVSSLILFLAALVILLSNNFSIANITSLETTDLILPFGVIIFSFGGYNVMAQIEKITNGDKDLMIKTGFLGTILPFIFFLTFAVIILGLYGENVAEIATSSLTGILGIIGNSIAFFAMTSAYIMSGLLLRDMFVDDYNIKIKTASISAMLPSILFTLLASPTFMNTLAFTGAVLAGTFAIILSFTVVAERKQVRRPVFITPGGIITPIITSLFFLAGILMLFL